MCNITNEENLQPHAKIRQMTCRRKRITAIIPRAREHDNALSHHRSSQKLSDSLRCPMAGILHENSRRKAVCLRRLFVNATHFLRK